MVKFSQFLYVLLKFFENFKEKILFPIFLQFFLLKRNFIKKILTQLDEFDSMMYRVQKRYGVILLAKRAI